MFDQYWKIRDKVPSTTLLFYRMGDFYELFGADAVQAAPVLEVQLTARNKDAEIPVPMCGVPAHAVDSYAEKLLSRGFKVALCEQISDPAETAGKAKLVERDVIRVLTPGLPIDLGRLESRQPHWFVSLSLKALKNAVSARVCVLDFLGSELFEGSLSSAEELQDLFKRLDPKEILAPIELLHRFSSKGSRGAEELHEWKIFFEAGASIWSERITPWTGDDALKNLREYIVYTQRCPLSEVSRLIPDEPKNLVEISGGFGANTAATRSRAYLPASVLEQWAVLPNLFDLLDTTGSAMGSRRLRYILSTPLQDVARLRNRQSLLKSLEDRAHKIHASAREVYDLERLLGRFRVGAASPKELVQLKLSIDAVGRSFQAADLPQVSDASLSDQWNAFEVSEEFQSLSEIQLRMAPLVERLQNTLDSSVDVAQLSTLVPLIKKGFDASFDELSSLQQNAEQWIVDFENRLKQETEIGSLKIRYNRVFGYYIEVTKTHLAKVPPHFERKQTTVSGERFTCPELRSKEHEVLTAGLRAEAKAKEILQTLQAEILANDAVLKNYFAYFSWIDAWAGVCLSKIKLSRYGKWNVPTLCEGDFSFEIEEARHPVVETLLGGSNGFVPNSISLGTDPSRLLLLTGPNMAGKSTLMRQTGLCILLAQCGLPVPATSMRLSPCDGFFSRMGASDKILEGESTFMVEMKETAAILRHAGRNSFVLIDEIGRGTSTEDGLSIARAVLEHLHDVTLCVGIFATHYHELSIDADSLPHAQNASMEIREWMGELIFLRSLKMQPAESSYGIYVAKMAGLPKNVIARAQKLLNETLAIEGGAGRKLQLDLFAATRSVRTDVELPSTSDDTAEFSTADSKTVVHKTMLPEELRSVDLNDLSPKQAWTLLENLQKTYADL